MTGSRPPVRVALVGCGAAGALYYSPPLRELETAGIVRVEALVDPDPGSAARLQTRFPGARYSEDPAQMGEGTIDLAILASPPRFHAGQTVQLLKNGTSVLCEKPMALTVAEAESMVEVAAVSGRVLAIGMVRRFLPACQTIRGILSDRVLGELRSFDFREGGAFRWPTRSTNYFDRNVSGGGVLADIGSHVLDLLTWWMGEPKRVRYADDAMGGIESNCAIELEFADGVQGTVRLSRDCELESRYLLRGSKGWLSWSIDTPTELQVRFGGMRSVLAGHLWDDCLGRSGRGPRVMNFEQSFLAQLRNVVAAVRGDETPFVTGPDALPGLRLMERCYVHRRLMPMGWLSDRERTRAEILARGEPPC